MSAVRGTPAVLAKLRRAAGIGFVALSTLVAVGVAVLFLALLGRSSSQLWAAWAIIRARPADRVPRHGGTIATAGIKTGSPAQDLRPFVARPGTCSSSPPLRR
jgi:hypothetical protein